MNMTEPKELNGMVFSNTEQIQEFIWGEGSVAICDYKEKLNLGVISFARRDHLACLLGTERLMF